MSDSGMAEGRLGLGGLLDVGAGLVTSLTHRSLARRVVELAGLRTDDRALDIGCGPGNSARLAATQAAHVTGVDPAVGMLRVARWLARRNPHSDRLTFRSGTAEALPLDEDSVTVAWATASFHHWSDRVAGLKEIRRALTPGGRLLLVERVLDKGRSDHGLRRDEVREAEEQLRIAGFAAVGTETVHVRKGRYFVVRGTAGEDDRSTL